MSEKISLDSSELSFQFPWVHKKNRITLPMRIRMYVLQSFLTVQFVWSMLLMVNSLINTLSWL